MILKFGEREKERERERERERKGAIKEHRLASASYAGILLVRLT